MLECSAGSFHVLDPAPCTPACDCADLSVACVCAMDDGCLTYERAVVLAQCDSAMPDTQRISRGCGYTLIELESSGGYSGSSYLYQGPDYELIGARLYQDSAFGICGSYETAINTIPDCADVSTCDICGGSVIPQCNDRAMIGSRTP